MGARAGVLALLLLIPALMGCAAVNVADTPVTIGVLAPFEGRYRDLGYEALYASRLALAEAGVDDVRLLPIDDGGTASTAAERVRAFQQGEVAAVIALGYAASDPTVDYGELPVIVVGGWGVPAGEAVFVLSAASIPDTVTLGMPLDYTAIDADTPIIGGDGLGLPSFAEAFLAIDDVTVLSSSTLPDAEYISRILESDQFAAEPGLLSTLVYDATRVAILSIATDTAISSLDYDGINGRIRFDEAGYWQDAPINRYVFAEDGSLMTP